MKIATIQFSPRAGDVGHNLDKIEGFIEKAGKVSLVVTPEISDIGYQFSNIRKLAAEIPNKTTERLSKIASDHGTAIVCGTAERFRGNIYNVALLFDQSGKIIGKYRKTHLCPIPPIDEPSFFKAGSEIKGFKLGKTLIGITICYDIRFPEIYRKLALQGVQIVVHPAAFPLSRIEHLEVCGRARAIENQIFLVVANYMGKIGNIEFGGSSMIVGPDGDFRGKASNKQEEIITADIDLSDIKKLRKEKPIISERRKELY